MKEAKASPNPQYYKNSNEIANKTVLKRGGSYSIGRSSKATDPGKWSSIHSTLIGKGII